MFSESSNASFIFDALRPMARLMRTVYVACHEHAMLMRLDVDPVARQLSTIISSPWLTGIRKQHRGTHGAIIEGNQTMLPAAVAMH